MTLPNEEHIEHIANDVEANNETLRELIAALKGEPVTV